MSTLATTPQVDLVARQMEGLAEARAHIPLLPIKETTPSLGGSSLAGNIRFGALISLLGI